MRILLAAALLSVQDADDAAFKRWSESKVGSWVKFKRETATADGKVMDLNQEITQTLVESDGEKVVIETVASGGAKGGKPKRDTYRVKTPIADRIEKTGEEEIEVAGKKRTCTWVQGNFLITGRTLARIYLHADVPGGIVRTDLIALGEGKPHARQVAVGWEKK